MTNEKQQNRKTFIDCYRIGRSLEYMDRYDQEQAWKKLNSAIQRKRLHRRISYMSSVAAMVAIAFTSVGRCSGDRWTEWASRCYPVAV